MRINEINERARAIGRWVEADLSAKQRDQFNGFVDFGEEEVALMFLVDWLAEDKTPIGESFRSEATALARDLGIEATIVQALSHSPRLSSTD